MERYIVNYKLDTNEKIEPQHRRDSSTDEMPDLTYSEDRQTNGFFITEKVYFDFLNHNNIEHQIRSILKGLDKNDFSNLKKIGQEIRGVIAKGELPYKAQVAIIAAFQELKELAEAKEIVQLNCVMSNNEKQKKKGDEQSKCCVEIKTEEDLLKTCLSCYVALFSDESIQYRTLNNLDHMKASVAIGIAIVA